MKQTICPVTGLACATPAPVQPAAYRQGVRRKARVGEIARTKRGTPTVNTLMLWCVAVCGTIAVAGADHDQAHAPHAASIMWQFDTGG